MKNLIILILFFCCILKSNSQNIKFDNSSITKYIGTPSFIGKNDSLFFVKFINDVKSYKTGFVIKAIRHKDMSVVYEKKIIPPKIDNRKTIIKSVMYLNGKICLFSSLHDKKTKQNKIYVNTINSKGLINKNPILIHTKDIENKNYYLFRKSKDRNSILCCYWDTKNEKKPTFNCKAINSKLNTLWEKNVEVPFTKDIHIDVNGNLLFLNTVMENDKKATNYHYELYSYNYKNNDINKALIEYGNNNIYDVKINFDNKNDIIVAGLYSNTASFKKKTFFYGSGHRKPDGFFISKFSSILLDDKKTNFFSFDSIPENENLGDFHIKSLITNSSNDIIISAEQQTFYTISGNIKSGTPSTTTYNYNDVIISSFSSNTEPKWIVRIDKLQEDNSTRLLSYFKLSNLDNTIIIYKLDKREKSISVNTINNFGALKTTELNNSTLNINKENYSSKIVRKGLKLELKNSLKIAENQIISFNYDLNKFVKLTLD